MGIWVQLLKSAGFVDVRMEARDFDAGATSADKDHRRPDIVCNFGGVRYIIDLTIAWASAAGAVAMDMRGERSRGRWAGCRCAGWS